MSRAGLVHCLAFGVVGYYFVSLSAVADPRGPFTWGVLSAILWSVYAVARGSDRLSVWDQRQWLWGLMSAVGFVHYLQYDTDFQGWGDVYFFCGRKMQFCTCDFTWNLHGWLKAAVLWNFILSTALGCQRLFIQLGLDGLLPGEEVVTKESFISICWRLVPYWLNKWEQQWGAECSSMMFELPHFAVELLVILPCVQILCARMRILAFAHVHPGQQAVVDQQQANHGDVDGREPQLAAPGQALPQQLHDRLQQQQQHQIPAGALAGGRAGDNQHHDMQAPHPMADHQVPWHQQPAAGDGRNNRGADGQIPRDNLAPNILKGCWEWSPGHRQLMSRLRSNLRIMLFTVVLFSLAAGNALFVPLFLERQILVHTHASGTQWVGSHPRLRTMDGVPGLLSRTSFLGQNLTRLNSTPAELVQSLPVVEVQGATAEQLAVLLRSAHYYGTPKYCRDERRLITNLQKHNSEISKMRDHDHQSLIVLVESALAVMRLSCEKFFVLISMFVSYLLFVEPPPLARAVIRLNSRLSTTFQRVILYSFPAVCWLYGAGFVFSAFVSIVFWGGPALHFYEGLRSSISVICIKSLQPSTAQQVERMGGSCAICWSDMVPAVAPTCQRTHPHTQPDPSTGPAGAASPDPPGSLRESPDGRGGPQAAAATAAAPAAVPAHSGSEGEALPCGHAYHLQCIGQWVQRCHVQGVTPTCPMCQVPIQLEVRWRFPWPWYPADGLLPLDLGQVGDPDEMQGPFAELQELLQDMPQILRPEEVIQQQLEQAPFVEMPIPHQH